MQKTINIGDKTVNRLGFGAMRITGDGVWGEPNDIENAKAVLRRAVELGVQFIDTADAYGPDVSENLIREALSPYDDSLLIATKGGLTRGGPGRWTPDGSPEHLRDAILGSLKRLGLAQIELYQFHSPDPNVPFMDSLNIFAELQRQGTVKHIGVSNVEPEQLQQALDAGIKVVSVQNHYNVTDREHEDVLELCEQNGIAFISYFPIGGNSGGFEQQVMDSIAETHDASVHQIALAWLLQHSDATLPIPGTANVTHLEENMKALNIELTDDEMQQLDQLSS